MNSGNENYMMGYGNHWATATPYSSHYNYPHPTKIPSKILLHQNIANRLSNPAEVTTRYDDTNYYERADYSTSEVVSSENANSKSNLLNPTKMSGSAMTITEPPMIWFPQKSGCNKHDQATEGMEGLSNNMYYYLLKKELF